MATTNQTSRVLELLKRFNNGQKINIDLLAQEDLWYGKSEKTIRRDLDVIKEYFPESFELIRGGKNEKGFYKAITKDTMNNFINKDTKALLVQTFNIAQRNNLLTSLDINESDKRILENEIKKSKDCYEFISKPFESKKGNETLLRDLENAIHHKRYIKVIYNTPYGTQEFNLKPYKIVFINENFYLASENTDERFKFTMLRLSQIGSIELLREQFHHNPDIKDFIKQLQTPFPLYKSNFREHLIKVSIHVDKDKAKFFKLKKYLPSQNIEKENDDTSLLVSFQVSQEREMEELIKKWIPYVKVIEPNSLKDKIESELKQYLNLN
jgi:predicted DNA-binding transcriptional regulator YafY